MGDCKPKGAADTHELAKSDGDSIFENGILCGIVVSYLFWGDMSNGWKGKEEEMLNSWIPNNYAIGYLDTSILFSHISSATTEK